MLAPDRKRWQGMRSIRDIRADMHLPLPMNPDSEYKPIVRPEKKFNPLRVPAKLQVRRLTLTLAVAITARKCLVMT